MGTAIVAGEGVDLVDDERPDGREAGAQRRGQQQIERLGGRHEDVPRVRELAPPDVGWRVTGPDVDPRRHEMQTELGGGHRDPAERGVEVALDVMDERL